MSKIGVTLLSVMLNFTLFSHFSVQERFPDKEETLDALAKRPLLRVQERLAKGKSKGLKKSKYAFNNNKL